MVTREDVTQCNSVAQFSFSTLAHWISYEMLTLRFKCFLSALRLYLDTVLTTILGEENKTVLRTGQDFNP